MIDRLDSHIAVEGGRGSFLWIWGVLMISRSLFVLYFISIFTCYYVAFVVVLSWLLFYLYLGYKNGFITSSSYGF